MADFAEIFASARVLVWAEIDTLTGTERIGNSAEGGDIVSVSATFALNTIPIATLVLATGRNVFNDKLATIHSLKSKLNPRDKVRVYARIIPGVEGVPEKIKPGTYMIFDGYLAGIGYQRSHNHANYVLNLVHWLDDLNNSSAINGDWLPGAPSSLARAALVARVEAATGVIQSGPIPDVARGLAELSLISKDLWEQSLKPVCVRLTQFPNWNSLPSGVDASDFTNAAAADALKRIPGPVATAENYYKPLAFTAFENVGSAYLNLSDALSDHYRRVFADSMSQNSFWAKIITEFAAEFMFAISPAVEWALPIPFCGGLAWDPTAAWDGKAAIAADEYGYANFNTNMAQLLEAVYVAYPTQSGTNVIEKTTSNPEKQMSFLGAFGRWPSVDLAKSLTNAQRKRGVKLFKLPPRWITNASGDSLNAINTAIFPSTIPSADASAASAGRAPAIPPLASAYESARAPMEKFAQHWYLDEILQQRAGELSGILRFDIAPGSIVKILTPSRDVTPPKAPLLAEDHLIAAITSVSYVINAERATAGTSFTFAHVRTPAEANVGALYAVDKPPLYKNKFVSAPLSVSMT